MPLCLEEGIGVIPWSPLARGFLAGGRKEPKAGDTERARSDELSGRFYFRDADHAIVDAVTEIARAHGVSNMQVALAFVLRHPAVTSPIIGATKMNHLEEAVAALPFKLVRRGSGAPAQALQAQARHRPHVAARDEPDALVPSSRSRRISRRLSAGSSARMLNIGKAMLPLLAENPTKTRRKLLGPGNEGHFARGEFPLRVLQQPAERGAAYDRSAAATSRARA